MSLDELKQRVDAGSYTDQQLRLFMEDAVAPINRMCDERFTLESLPRDLHSVVAKYVNFELYGESLVKSESMAGMSQTFVTKDELDESIRKDLLQLGYIRIRFIPIGRGSNGHTHTR